MKGSEVFLRGFSQALVGIKHIGIGPIHQNIKPSFIHLCKQTLRVHVWTLVAWVGSPTVRELN